MAFVNVHDATGAILFRYDAGRNLIAIKRDKVGWVLVDLESTGAARSYTSCARYRPVSLGL